MLNKKLAGALGAGIFALGIAVSAAPAQAAIQTVQNNNDSGPGSLRNAITETNMFAGRDTILFQIQGNTEISLATPLPPITRPVTIRGYSQAGSSPATAGSAANPTVEIDASNVTNGLLLTGNGIDVSGLVINGAQADGIRILGNRNVVTGSYLGTNAAGTASVPNAQYGVHVDGNDNVLGGPAPADRNLISGNDVGGVLVHGERNVVEGSYLGTNETGTAGLGGGDVVVEFAAQNTVKDNLLSFNLVGVTLRGDDNTVQGNKIGTDVTGGVELGNLTGVSVNGGDGNVIGGAGEGEGNLVSGNLLAGVSLNKNIDDPAEDNAVQGNLVGTTAAGTAPLPNGTGVVISGSGNNDVGGTDPGAGNVISGNESDGVRIQFDADENDVQGNWIGTDEAETVDLGNGESGVEIAESGQNRVGATLQQNPANVVAFNDGDGVTVRSGVGNSIVRNSLRENDALGIDLGGDGTTANDGGNDDADSGANTLQNGPEIASATTTDVEWELETEPNAEYRLEFFSNDACDPSGSGEGQTFLATVDVTTNANGDADDGDAPDVDVQAAVGQFVSMTATRLINGVARSTSELSPCEEVVQ
jgi:trimeric autotransporter adhesin